jgi:hypothetical protein
MKVSAICESSCGPTVSRSQVKSLVPAGGMSLTYAKRRIFRAAVRPVPDRPPDDIENDSHVDVVQNLAQKGIKCDSSWRSRTLSLGCSTLANRCRSNSILLATLLLEAASLPNCFSCHSAWPGRLSESQIGGSNHLAPRDYVFFSGSRGAVKKGLTRLTFSETRFIAI